LSQRLDVSEWEFLIGYPLEEAEQVLREEAVDYQVIVTAAPKRQASHEELDDADSVCVIAVRSGSPLTLVCAGHDWNVS
jgi:hypothetical protein